MGEIPFDIGVLAGNEPIDEVRLLRLVQAGIDGDLLQVKAVANEVYRDDRGWEIATWQIVMGLSVGLARQWVSESSAAAVTNGIRQSLLKFNTDPSSAD
jgi:hypothetical protein